jgi:hypothetical protein
MCNRSQQDDGRSGHRTTLGFHVVPSQHVQLKRSVHRLPSKADSPPLSRSPFGTVAVHCCLHVAVQRTQRHCVCQQNQRPNCVTFSDLLRV